MPSFESRFSERIHDVHISIDLFSKQYEIQLWTLLDLQHNIQPVVVCIARCVRPMGLENIVQVKMLHHYCIFQPPLPPQRMRQLTTFHFLVFVVQSVFTKYSAEQSTFQLLSSTGLPHSDEDKIPCVSLHFQHFLFQPQNITFILLPLPIKRYTTPNIYSKPQSQMHRNLLQKLHSISGLSYNSKKSVSQLKDYSCIPPQSWYIL